MTKEQNGRAARGVDIPDAITPEWPVIGMTVEETARALRVSFRTVQDMLAAGKLPGRLVGNKWRVSPKALDAFLGGFEHERREGGPDETAAPVADEGNKVTVENRMGKAATLGRG